jgi:hypothetical protein
MKEAQMVQVLDANIPFSAHFFITETNFESNSMESHTKNASALSAMKISNASLVHCFSFQSES